MQPNARPSIGLIATILLAGAIATGAVPQAHAARAALTLEIVTEPSVQATAHRQWLQLLTALGYQDIRIRSSRSGDRPQLQSTGTKDRPRYRVTGLLDGRDQLHLPGGRYTLQQRAKLGDYLDRLAADGPEGVTAKTGKFGLTEKQFNLAFAELTKPLIASLRQPGAQVVTTTEGLSLVDLLKQVQQTSKLKIQVDNRTWEVIQQAGPMADNVQPLTLGAGLALLLRSHDLVLVPEKKRGEPLSLRIARKADIAGEVWPVGWPAKGGASKYAPKLMEQLNAEVDGFTLTEAIDAIAPRAGIPFYWDHAMLRDRKIDPTTLQVTFARRKTHLKRVVDRLLFQARLRGEIKVDESGTVFYWISR